MNELIKVLYVDDDAADRALICGALADHKRVCEVTEVLSRQGFEAQLARADEYDVVLSECDVCGFAGVGVVDAVRAVRPGLPVVIVTRIGSEEIAAEAFRRGAAEYVIKSPDHLKRLPDTIQAVVASPHPANRNGPWQVSLRDRQEGQIAGLVVSSRGVTDLKQAEEELRVSERFSHSTLNALLAHVAIVDEAGVILSVNSAWREFARDNGVAPDCVSEGSNYLSVCDKATGDDAEEAHLIAEAIRVLLRGEREPVVREYPCHSPDEKRWFVVRATRFPDDGPARVVIAHENITQRKLAEEQARDQARFQQTLIDSIPIPVFYKQRDGRYLGCNRAFVEWIGLSKKEVVGKTCGELFAGEYAELAREMDDLLYQTKSPQISETTVRLPNGSVREKVIHKATYADADGCVGGLIGAIEDVTNRNVTRRELAASESRLKRAQQVAHIGDWEWDLRANEVHWSDETYRIFGLQPGEVAPSFELARRFVHPADLTAWEGIFGQAIEATGSFAFEYQAVREDGQVLWIRNDMEITRDANACATRLFGTCQDISAQKKTEDGLRDAKEYTDSIIGSMADMLLVVSPVGEITRANQAACNLLDYSAQELHGANIRLLMVPEREPSPETGARDGEPDGGEVRLLMQHIPLPRCRVSDLLEHDVLHGVETELQSKDGKHVPVLLSCAVLRSWSGVVKSLVFLAQDITARKEVEDRLMHSEMELSKVYESAPVILVLLDEQLRVTRANHAAVVASGGVPADDVMGVGAGDLLRCVRALEDPRGCGFGSTCHTCVIRTMVRDTLENGTSHHRVEQSLLVEMEQGHVELDLVCSSVRLIIDARPYVLLSIDDVTDQKTAERLARQRDAEMAHMNRLHMVGVMSATLAHELNQPLYAINNYVGGVRRRLGNAPPFEGLAQLKGAMDEVSVEVTRAAAIIAHLRGFVRGREPHHSSSDIARVLRQAVGLLRPLARDKSVYLVLDVSDGLPLLHVDAVQIEQVVVNLVANAIDAAVGLPMTRRTVMISGRVNEDNAVEVAVRDCGIGIPVQVRDNLFEAFVSTKPTGLGMGLAISRRIIESHGGRIWHAEHEPYGAAFHFSLSVDDALEGTCHGN